MSDPRIQVAIQRQVHGAHALPAPEATEPQATLDLALVAGHEAVQLVAAAAYNEGVEYAAVCVVDALAAMLDDRERREGWILRMALRIADERGARQQIAPRSSVLELALKVAHDTVSLSGAAAEQDWGDAARIAVDIYVALDELLAAYGRDLCDVLERRS